MNTNQALVVEILRGDGVESRHEVVAVVLDSCGGRIGEWGNVTELVFPRSALKPIQAIPLVQSGAADHYRLGSEELALACSSHRGEKEHIDKINGWLERIELTVAALECGTHEPRARSTAQALIRSCESPNAVHNNCSGKHTGMLTTSKFLNEDIAGYSSLRHPCQIRVMETFEALCGISVTDLPHGTDGCGVPTVAVPLWRLAFAYAQFAKPTKLPTATGAAILRLQQAMAAEPFLVDGTGRFTTDVIKATRGDILVKSGAEGVYIASVPREGLGVALKVLDGGARAAPIAMGHILSHLGLLSAEQQISIEQHLLVNIVNCSDRVVGQICVNGALSSAA